MKISVEFVEKTNTAIKRGSILRKQLLFILMLLLFFIFQTGDVFAWDHGASSDPEYKGDRTFTGDASLCDDCHNGSFHRSGPHGNYSTTTNKCRSCHLIHEGKNPSLLPGLSVTGACMMCHDLTQSRFGPYNFYNFNSATPSVYSAHRVEGISFPNEFVNASGITVEEGEMADGLSGDIIPGGEEDGSTGNFDSTGQGQLAGTSLTCFGCHSVHAVANSMIAPYLGESEEKVDTLGLLAGHEAKINLTNRLLKIKPNNSATPVTFYGSQWCLACHKGRANNLFSHSHPVNETAYGYDFLNNLENENFIFAGGRDAALADIETKGFVYVDDGEDNGTWAEAHVDVDPRSNAWYSMMAIDPISDNPRADGNVPFNVDGPACQQCHGNPRDVEGAFSATLGTENPIRMSFPHVGPYEALLVEPGDDFCTNCHNDGDLP